MAARPAAPLSDYVRQQVREGLQAEAAAPVGTGYAELLAGYTPAEGMFGRAELGWHPADALTLFGYGEDSSRFGFSAGLGVRLAW